MIQRYVSFGKGGIEGSGERRVLTAEAGKWSGE